MVDGITKAICTSLKVLNEFIDMSKKKDSSYTPWFEVSIMLIKQRISFSIDFNESTNSLSIRSILNGVMKDILDIAINVFRIDSGGIGDYLIEIKDNFEIRVLTQRIT